MDIHDLLFRHLVEYIITIFGFLTVITRFRKELQVLTFFFEGVILLAKMANIYYKNHPEKEKSFNRFVGTVVKHYLTTNAQGKKIASNTKLDEKIKKLFKKSELKHDDEVDGLG